MLYYQIENQAILSNFLLFTYLVGFIKRFLAISTLCTDLA